VEVTEQDLRERYESLATEELLELKARATLTDTAARLLEQVLAARSVSSEEQVRLGAQLIDAFIAAAIVLMSFFLGIVAFPLLILGSVAAFAYLLLADGLPRGQSIGKRAVDIAVIDRQTRKPCTFIQSFLRNFLLMLLGIIDWVFIFGRTRQRLGDMAANTIVVRLKQHAAADAT
jgi:uncharacterized RDD family membrane protein YckC